MSYLPFDAEKKVLVTGAAGFIGFHLSKRLLGLGATVVGFDNVNDYYDVGLKESRLEILREYPKFTFVKGDLADEAAVMALFEQYQPDIVVNLAAQAGVRYSIDHPRSYIDSNIIGFFNILESCRHHKVEHLLFASSSSVYGNQKKTPFSTTDNVDHPISLYAATKKSDELMAYTYSHLYGIPATACASSRSTVRSDARIWLISNSPTRSARENLSRFTITETCTAISRMSMIL